MPEKIINLVKGERIGSDTEYRDFLPENMYAVITPTLGAAGYMTMHPGLQELGTGSGPDRGAVWNERLGAHFRVSSAIFLAVNTDGTSIRYGDIPGTENVSMPYSFNTQGIIGGGNFYLFDFGAGLVQVTDPDVGNPIDGVFIDGYYFLTDGEFLYHTDINDEASIDPLKFATSEFSPDPTLGVGKTQDNKAIAFNRYSTEYFANVATANFAFQRIPSRALKIGIVSTHSKCEMNDRWYIMGGRKEGSVGVYALGVGSSPQVSTREVDKIIAQYTEEELSDAYLEARVEDGYSFLYVHLPNETLMFNETLAQSNGIDTAWSILKSGHGSAPWRGIHGVFEPRLSKWVYGDRQGLRFGTLEDNITTQYGEVAEWVLYTPFMYLEGGSIDELEIETMPGHNNDDDATVFASLTYNGVTYGKEWTELYGVPDDYSKRFVIRRLGYIRDWVGFKFRGVTKSKMSFGRGFIRYG